MFLKLAFTLSVINQLLPLRPLDWSSLAVSWKIRNPESGILIIN